MRDQVDACLSAPGRDDRLDRGVEEHGLELGGPLGGRGADVTIPVHALPDLYLEPALADCGQRGIDAGLQHAGNTR